MSLGGSITEFLCQQASANWCNVNWLSAPPSDTTSNSFINWLWKFGIKASFLSGWENMVQIYWREFLNETKIEIWCQWIELNAHICKWSKYWIIGTADLFSLFSVLFIFLVPAKEQSIILHGQQGMQSNFIKRVTIRNSLVK